MRNNRIYLFLILCLGACVFLICPESFAAEKAEPWRKSYDLIMLWVNFGILVALFLKFARKPMMDALHGVREKLAGELSGLKDKHADVQGSAESEESRLKNIQEHLDEIKARILEMGEKEKQKIIDQAKESAKRMIEDAKNYAGIQIIKARKQLSDDMVDIAISMVENKLKKKITIKDNDKLINDFLGNIETTKMNLN